MKQVFAAVACPPAKIIEEYYRAVNGVAAAHPGQTIGLIQHQTCPLGIGGGNGMVLLTLIIEVK